MEEYPQLRIVFTTLEKDFDHSQIAREIIANKLGFCVQVQEPVKSYYSWDGEIAEESEKTIVIKTHKEKLTKLEHFLNLNHPYDVPEILVCPVSSVSAEYLSWALSSIDI